MTSIELTLICPNTGKPFGTGLVADDKSTMRVDNMTIQCPLCHKVHKASIHYVRGELVSREIK